MARPEQSAASSMACPDPTAHEKSHQPRKLQQHAAGAALYGRDSTRDANYPLGPDGKLSSAGAATSLKYARAQDLPSFPSVGIDTHNSGLTAATLANANKTSIEWWKPGPSAAAGKAAMLAKDYKMAPLWQPEASAAGSKAAVLAAQAPAREWWQPQASKDGNAAAEIAMRNKNLSPQLDYGYTEAGHANSLLAARRSVRARNRADSTPISAETYPDQGRATENALAAAYSADSTRLGSKGMEAARVKNIGQNVSREMFGEKPPIRMEVEEKRHQDALRASAISMAKQLYASQTVDDDGNITLNHARSAAAAAEPGKPGPDIKKQAMQYLTLQDAAQKLAAERLARIEDQHESAAFRDYYGYPSQKRRSRLSVKGLSRRRASSEPAGSDSDDEFRARRVRNQMSEFNNSLAQIDAKKRAKDRENLMAAAERKVQAQMNKMDQKVFDETGKMSPAMMEEWDTKARARAVAASEVRMQNHGKVHVGGGKYLDQSEINEIATARIQPTLDDINEKAEQQRAKDEENRLDQEERKREAQSEKQKQVELKAEQKRQKQEEKQAEKTRKQEERVERQVDQSQKSEWKRLLTHEKRKSKSVEPSDQLLATPILPEDNVGQFLERAPTGGSSIADVEIVAHRNATTSSTSASGPTPNRKSSAVDDSVKKPGEAFEAPKSPTKKRFSTLLNKLKRKSKEEKDTSTPNKGFMGGAALTGASHSSPSATGHPTTTTTTSHERSPSISSLSSDNKEHESPELRRGRSKTRAQQNDLNGGDSDEFEEARDTFDLEDGALAPPPKFVSKKTGSPARETRFSEAL